MDVVILGGGIVGLTLANLLAKQDLKIALIEPNPTLLEWDNSQYDIRCSAITPAAQNIFSAIGVWEQIIAQRTGVILQMLIWDQAIHNKITFNCADVQQSNLGYIVENRVLTSALYKNLSNFANAEIMHAFANEVVVNADHVQIFIGTRCLECKLIIGADGANSWLRTRLQLPTYGWDYNHSALVATMQTELPHANCAMQRFMPDGPLAFLPLNEPNLCSIVWSSNAQKIGNLMQCTEKDFCEELAAELNFMLGSLQLRGIRACFALRMLHALKYVLPRAALLGDAAHVIHPLAGQGLNLGILDAAVLAEVLQHAVANKEDLGALNVLRRYERKRKGHNLGMIALMEAIKRVFANTETSLLRAQGINLLNNLSFAKNAMICFINPSFASCKPIS